MLPLMCVFCGKSAEAGIICQACSAKDAKEVGWKAMIFASPMAIHHSFGNASLHWKAPYNPIADIIFNGRLHGKPITLPVDLSAMFKGSDSFRL